MEANTKRRATWSDGTPETVWQSGTLLEVAANHPVVGIWIVCLLSGLAPGHEASARDIVVGGFTEGVLPLPDEDPHASACDGIDGGLTVTNVATEDYWYCIDWGSESSTYNDLVQFGWDDDGDRWTGSLDDGQQGAAEIVLLAADGDREGTGELSPPYSPSALLRVTNRWLRRVCSASARSAGFTPPSLAPACESPPRSPPRAARDGVW